MISRRCWMARSGPTAHLCPGQVVGVRMAMLGCRLVGLNNPRRLPQIKKLIVYVEIDRCATDAIAYVTGVKLGRRSLKFVDNGIMAATFVNLDKGKAFRIVSTESSRDLAHVYAPGIADVRQQQIDAYTNMPDDEMFNVMPVRWMCPSTIYPVLPGSKSAVQSCGAMVRDKKEVLVGNRVLCRPLCLGYLLPTAGKSQHLKIA
jgi:formylmethanofuran dehydrogenase subunit E